MNQNNQAILYYVHDPMCSWCWAFVPSWSKIQSELAGHLEIHYLLGGLAADSAQVMPLAMQQTISGYWKTIQQRVPGTQFNFDFWSQCQPRRATYPACRAVIAARAQHLASEKPMIRAIQEAYYLQAKNPSDDEVLADLAAQLDLDRERFLQDLNHPQTQHTLEIEMQQGQALGAQGFPSLILQQANTARYIPLDYNHPDVVLKQLATFL